MFSWIAAAILAVAAWLAASLYLWLVRRRENEASAGLHALAGLHWFGLVQAVYADRTDERVDF